MFSNKPASKLLIMPLAARRCLMTELGVRGCIYLVVSVGLIIFMSCIALLLIYNRIFVF